MESLTPASRCVFGAAGEWRVPDGPGPADLTLRAPARPRVAALFLQLC